MAKKKVIKKAKTVAPEEEAPKESKKDAKKVKETPEEDIDAFDLNEVPKEEEEEVTDIEREMAGQEFEEEIQEERFYNIPLAKEFLKTPKWKRAKRAVKITREFLTRHMKPVGPVYLSQELNERIWENGIKSPPRKLRVRVTKSVDGVVRAYLA